MKKIVLIIIIILVFIIGMLTGRSIGNFKNSIPMAHCQESNFPKGDFDIINLDTPMVNMFQNYFSSDLNFVQHYVPKDISLEEYYEVFNSGGFYYLKTDEGKFMSCGFYK